MARPLERWAKQAVQKEYTHEFEPVCSTSILQDVEELKLLHRLTWRERELEIRKSGVPTMMPEGTYGGLLAYPPQAVITTTSINGSVNLWPNLTYTPIPANSVLAPQAYRVAVVGTLTSGVTPGNLGLNPQLNSTGTWTTGGTAISGGNSFGASSTLTGTASIAGAFFYLLGDLTIRTAGTAANTTGMFQFATTHPTAGPTSIPATSHLLFGGTTTVTDVATTGQSFQLAAVHTTTVWTWTVQQIHWMDWN